MAEKRRPWGKWYWGDWRGDTRLRRCSFAARGLWADMLSVMGGESEHFGFLMAAGPLSASDLAGFFGSTRLKVGRLLDEMEKNRVFSRTGDPELPADLRDLIPECIPDGVIFSRRMVRDMAKEAREHGWGTRGGGNPELRCGTAPLEERARPYKRSDSPAKTRRIFEKDDGQCHWCGIDLAYDGTAGHNFHNFYHVNHLIPVANGGKSEEENLVAACAKCNHDRARIGWPFGRILRNYDPLLSSDHNVRQEPGKISDSISDSKAQRLETRYQIPDKKKKAPSEEEGRQVASQGGLFPPAPPPAPPPPSPAPKPNDAKAALYARGRELFGNSAGAIITQLLKIYDGKIRKAMAKVEDAAEKRDPKEYIWGIIQNHPDGWGKDIQISDPAM